MYTTIPLQWVLPLVLCGLCADNRAGCRPVAPAFVTPSLLPRSYVTRTQPPITPAYYEKKAGCFSIPIKYSYLIACILLPSFVMVFNFVDVFSDSLKARLMMVSCFERCSHNSIADRTD